MASWAWSKSNVFTQETSHMVTFLLNQILPFIPPQLLWLEHYFYLKFQFIINELIERRPRLMFFIMPQGIIGDLLQRKKHEIWDEVLKFSTILIYKCKIFIFLIVWKILHEALKAYDLSLEASENDYVQPHFVSFFKKSFCDAWDLSSEPLYRFCVFWKLALPTPTTTSCPHWIELSLELPHTHR
jgi:hypothetical protein